MAPPPDSPIIITLRDVYDVVTDLADDVSGLPKVVADHENRIRFLEKAVWVAAGLGMAGGAGLGTLL